MLKFLTQKLKTHSINEENGNEKADENHDSGTESDDETEDLDFLKPASLEINLLDLGFSMASLVPDKQDPHSSEEELEVINNPPRPLKMNCQPEKRKWSQVGETFICRCTPENEENISHFGNLTPSTPCCTKCYGDESIQVEHSGSSDEEVHNLLASMATPVEFRTSPPLEALKPGGRTPINRIRSMSPPAKQLHCEVSPRKRSRHARHVHMPRPFLDFEKMQQLKAHSVTAWGHPADHGGELSVFCW